MGKPLQGECQAQTRADGDAKTVISPLKVPSSANKNLQYRTYQLILHMREDSVTKGYVKTWVVQHSKQSYKET